MPLASRQHVRDHGAGAGRPGGAGVDRGARPGGRARRGRHRRRGQRGQPGRPAAAPGALPAAAGRVGDHRAGVLRADRRARRGGHAAGRSATRCARCWPAAGTPSRSRCRPPSCCPIPAGVDLGDGRRAARGGLHGLVERRRRRPAGGRRDVPRPGRQQRHRHPRHPGGQGARRPGGRHRRAPRTGCSAAASWAPTSSSTTTTTSRPSSRRPPTGTGPTSSWTTWAPQGLAANVDALAPDGRLLVIGMQGGAKAELEPRRAAAQAGQRHRDEPARAAGRRARTARAGSSPGCASRSGR